MYLNLYRLHAKQLQFVKHLKQYKFRNYHSDGVFGYRKKIETKYNLPEDVVQQRFQQSNFYRLVTAYRQFGHLIADVNPVSFNPPLSEKQELTPNRYGLSLSDKISFKGIIHNGQNEGTVAEAIEFLKHVYGNHISAEFLHLETEEEIEWFSKRIEELHHEVLSKDERIDLASELLKCQTFDHFLANKFPGLKRYGGEGAESMMGFFSEVFHTSAEDSLEQIVIGMPHRGRLNFLTGMLHFQPAKMFVKLKGLPDFPTKFKATGDVVSHCISSTELMVNNKPLHVTVLYNPSHLEVVNPVSMGKTRAKQMSVQDGNYSSSRRWSDKILNIQVHGDAAFAGQGINQECLQLSNVPHFEIGGSLHLIVNNQVGFTTPSDRGRSTRYCTDLAKMLPVPILHVNGDYPEAVLKATRIAMEYQRKFRKDVFVDMNCFRQWGHNEMDDPTFTNPELYKIIHSRKTVPDRYSEYLIGEGVITKEKVDEIINQHYSWLSDELSTAESYEVDDPCFKNQWQDYNQAQEIITTWDTGVHSGLLSMIGNKSVEYPTDFKIHPHLERTYVKSRLSKIAQGSHIDWATAEALAFGSLLYEGYNVRISGQDVGRGTFSHRHVMLVDQETNNTHIPLNEIHSQQTGFLEVANSILSEEAVLGFEYGMSVENPKNLIIWEAQFGDFFNGAQIIFDTLISSGEAKWLWSTGIVILLPHGYDGAGPEHSSSRLERFLQMSDSKENEIDSDNVNMEICQPSTPAQYFHLIRRQMVRNFRKPLIIIAPKTLLRLPAATSHIDDMTCGTNFLPVIGETISEYLAVNKIIFCSGKHYYSLKEEQTKSGKKNVALIRIESFCPFPTYQLQEAIQQFPNAKDFLWSQEEPRNMGAWSFLKPRFEHLLGKNLNYCGRDTLPTPAVGVGKWHQEQVKHITTKPFEM